MAFFSSSLCLLLLCILFCTVQSGTWLSFNAGPGMAGMSDLDLSGLNSLKLARHTRNVVDVCAEQHRRMAKRAAAGFVTNEDRRARQFCDYLMAVQGNQ